MNLIYIGIFVVPVLAGVSFAAFATWLKYRQSRAMLDVLKIYAERGETPPIEVLTALTKGFSHSEPGVNTENSNPLPRTSRGQGPMHYWSLVGLFGVMTAGFGYVAWVSGSSGFPFLIVAVTMGAVMVWSIILAVTLTVRR